MRRSEKELVGYSILAKDGELGKVDEFYFDDEKWIVRYLVVNTGDWLSGRRVLISSGAMNKPEWETRTFPVELTRDQVRNSPDIDTDKPVSRQHETALCDYYAWPTYWIGAFTVAGTCGYGVVPCIGTTVPEKQATDATLDRPKWDPHLRSTRRVIGYHIQAQDGEIGHVDDFIFDDAKWDLCHLVVNTRNWLPGRKVLLAPDRITRVSWEESKVFTNLTRETLKNNPEYDS